MNFLDLAVEYWPMAAILAIVVGWIVAITYEESPRYWRDES
jgi:hypothetical protein